MVDGTWTSGNKYSQTSIKVSQFRQTKIKCTYIYINVTTFGKHETSHYFIKKLLVPNSLLFFKLQDVGHVSPRTIFLCLAVQLSVTLKPTDTILLYMRHCVLHTRRQLSILVEATDLLGSRLGQVLADVTLDNRPVAG